MVSDTIPLAISIAATIAAGVYTWVWLPMKMRRAYRQSLLTLARAVEVKDAGSEGHGERVADSVVRVAREMRVPPKERLNMEYAGFLQDIGNVQVPHSILNKPGPLTDEDQAVVRMHPEIGAEIVSNVKFLRDIAPIIRHHHEAWDGSGYPDGLSGDAIPLGARILAVCTAYDAIVSPRAYRDRLDEDSAVSEVKASAGSKYDPAVVEAFLRALKRSRRGEKQRP